MNEQFCKCADTCVSCIELVTGKPNLSSHVLFKLQGMGDYKLIHFVILDSDYMYLTWKRLPHIITQNFIFLFLTLRLKFAVSAELI